MTEPVVNIKDAFENAELTNAELDAEIELQRFANLCPLEYDRERKEAADRLGCRISVLDAEVKKRRRDVRRKGDDAAKPDMAALEASAAAIIDSGNVLDLFARTMRKVIAGEIRNCKLLYLVATSRLLDRTMHAAIKGTSAGGKSELRKKVLEFFPPESVVAFTSLSEKALIYSDEDFAHKILSMGEATATDEQDFQDYLLRELMSEGRICHHTVRKVGNDIESYTIEKEGPVSFVVTTTRNKLNPENETRMLSLEIDDTESQTKAVLGKVAHVEGLNHVGTEIDYQPWQDFQRSLETGERRVVVPFANVLANAVPPASVRLRRDFGQVLRAIKVHALLHREHRERDEQGRIVADVENDYAAIRELMNSLLAESSGLAVDPQMQATIDAVGSATTDMPSEEGATAQTVAELLKLDKSAAWRRLRAATGEGFVKNLETRRGQPGRYRITGQKIKPIEMLPEPETIASAAYTLATPSNPVQPCNPNGITKEKQQDNGCTTGCTAVADCTVAADQCNPVATAHATANSRKNNAKSLPVARLHENSPPSEGNTTREVENQPETVLQDLQKDACEERAGILEADGLSREEAERQNDCSGVPVQNGGGWEKHKNNPSADSNKGAGDEAPEHTWGGEWEEAI